VSALLATVFVASLLGSLHCVGMCGPFALLAGTGDGRTFRWAPTVAYSGGRLISYTVVGVLFGSLGLALNRSFSFGVWQQTATGVAGALMVFVGGIALARQLGWQIRLPRVAGPLERALGGLIRWGKRLSPIRRAAMIGLASSLMPCGWLYVFALAAAGTASPWGGGLVMAVFWSGTVPIMVGLGLGWGRISRQFQAKVPLTMAILVILIGVFTLVYRSPVHLGPGITAHPHVAVVEDLDGAPRPSGRPAGLQVPQSMAEAMEQIQTIDHRQLPCCQGQSTAPIVAPTADRAPGSGQAAGGDVTGTRP
jgi:sulfite exporter TauE/SafE